MSRLLVCTALGIEARALRSEGTEVAQVGMGPRRAAASVRLLAEFDALVVAGFGGATVGSLRPGDVVVASEVRRGDRVVPCPWAPAVARLVERALRAGPEAVLVPTYDAVVGRTAVRTAGRLGVSGIGTGTETGAGAGYAPGCGPASEGTGPGCSGPVEYRPGAGRETAVSGTDSGIAVSGTERQTAGPGVAADRPMPTPTPTPGGYRASRDTPPGATALRNRPLPVAVPPAIAAAPDPGRPAVVTAPIETVDRVASRATLARLAALGVGAVDMEAFPLVEAAAGRPFAVVRVIVDNPDHPLLRPSTVRASFLARNRLRAIGPALRAWAAELGRDPEH